MTIAITPTLIAKRAIGNAYLVTFKLTTTGSYVSNGFAITARNVALADIELLILEPTVGITFDFDYTNGKAIAYNNGGSEYSGTPNFTDLRGFAIGT
jgi:hypothetical protein